MEKYHGNFIPVLGDYKKKKKQKEKKVRMKLFLDIPYFVYFKIRIKLI